MAASFRTPLTRASGTAHTSRRHKASLATVVAVILLVATGPAPRPAAAPAASRNLSSGAGFSGKPAVASAGDATYVTWLELGPGFGYRVLRMNDSGTTTSSTIRPEGSGNISLWHPQIAASGDYVHVTWEQHNADSNHYGVWLASSASRGSSWNVRMISGTGSGCCPGTAARADGGWSPRIAAAGDLASVAYYNAAGDVRLWVGGVTGDGVNRLVGSAPGGSYAGAWDVAMEASSTMVAIRSGSGALNVLRYAGPGATADGGAFGVDGGALGIERPRIAAEGDHVFLVYEASGGLWQVGSGDRGATFTAPALLSTGAAACSWCGSVDITTVAGRAHAIWSGPGGLFERGFGVAGVDPLNLVTGGRAEGTVGATRNGVVVAFSSGPNWEEEVYAAVRRRGESSFDIRNLSESPSHPSFSPDVAAHGGFFGTAWREWQSSGIFDTNDLEVFFSTGALDPPDVSVVHSEIVQSAYGVDRLVKNKPSLIRATIRSTLPGRTSLPVRVVTHDGGTESTSVYTVTVEPGGQNVLLPDKGLPFRPQGTLLEYELTLDPANKIEEHDESNNTYSRDYKVKDTRPFHALVVPIVITGTGGGRPPDEDVQLIADGTEAYLKAAFPLDPSEVSVKAQVGSPLYVENGMMDDVDISKKIIGPLDAMNPGNAYDSVMGVPPEAWLGTHASQHPGAYGLAFSHYGAGDYLGQPSLFFGVPKSVIVDPLGYGGWEAAHELSHQLGWVTEGHHLEDPNAGHHLIELDAPGNWVQHRYEIRHKKDWMFNSSAGADVTEATDRWLSAYTWDFLLDRFALDPIDPAAIRVNGTIGADGSVTAGTWYQVEGILDARLGDTGDVGVRFENGAGTLLATSGFQTADAVTSDSGGVARLPFETFSATLPWVDGTERLELTDADGNVIFARETSDAAPQVEAFPDGAETFRVGDTLTIRWVATDADQDPLSSVVSLSLDGGTSWRPLAGDVTASSLDVHLSPDMETDEALVRVETSDGLRTTKDESATTFRIVNASEPERIVFAASDEGDDWGAQRLWTIQPDGSNKTRLTSLTEHWEDPDWSPDGQQIVAAESGSGPLWLLERSPTGVWERTVQLTTNTGDSQPEWSPDGSTIVFTRRVGAEDQVGIVKPDGTGEVIFPGRGKAPTWSPDGSRIAFERLSDIYSMNSDGSDIRQLTSESMWGDHTGEPAWSPDGKWIAVAYTTGSRQRYTEIALIRLNTNNGPYDITGFRARGDTRTLLFDPQWSPDGRTIMFTDWPGCGCQQRLMTVNAGQVIDKILSGGYDYGDPPQEIPNACCGVEGASWRAGRAAPPLPSASGPTADAGGPHSVDEGQTITLDASASTVPAGPGTYAWDLDGDGEYDDATGQSATFEARDDDYDLARVAVTDFYGVIDTDGSDINVNNVAPTLSNVTATIDEDLVGRVTADFTDPGPEDDHLARVDWGDGSPAESASILYGEDGASVTATHIYSGTGPFEVTLTVTDDDGGEATAHKGVAALAPNARPVSGDVSATTDRGAPVEFDLDISDPDAGPGPLGIEIVDPPTHGNLFLLAADERDGRSTVAYVPDPVYSGPDSFTYRATDGRDASDPSTASINVRSAAQPSPTVSSSATSSPAPSPTSTPTNTPTQPLPTATASDGAPTPQPSTPASTAPGTRPTESESPRPVDTPPTSPTPRPTEPANTPPPSPSPTGRPPSPGDDGPCTILGTAGNDVLRGSPYADVICGLGGRDRLVGGRGNDDLRGGRGDDVLIAGAGGDVLRGGRGFDRARGGVGNDRAAGGVGEDGVWGGRGRDRLIGGGNLDWLFGGRGRDHLLGGSGSDRLHGQVGADRLRGGLGRDMLDGGRQADVCIQNPGRTRRAC